MNYNTVFVGMDAHYSKILNYLEAMRFHYGENVTFICGYEAGCLGFALYHQLTVRNVKCIILAPTTMANPDKSKKIKTDKREDAMRVIVLS